MEPMTLGSPSGSPLPSSGSGYLPSFLMGDTPTTPRTNTLSPTKGRSSLAFSSQSPSSGSALQTPDVGSRASALHHQQRFTLGGAHLNQSSAGLNHHNTSVTGPPTQGLFDSFRNEKQSFQTPTKSYIGSQQQQFGEVTSPGFSGVGHAAATQNDSYLNRSGFNVSRVMSPIPAAREQDFLRNASLVSSPPSHVSHSMSQSQLHLVGGNDYWITVFGFPQSASSMILSHFAQCGSIIDKVFATQHGNWVHLRFTSRLECDKALNYNGKVIGQNLMIGVQYCNDVAVVGKENNHEDRKEYSLSRVRSLTHIAYKNAQHPTDVVPSPTAPKRSSGIVNKAMDLFFGW